MLLLSIIQPSVIAVNLSFKAYLVPLNMFYFQWSILSFFLTKFNNFFQFDFLTLISVLLCIIQLLITYFLLLNFILQSAKDVDQNHSLYCSLLYMTVSVFYFQNVEIINCLLHILIFQRGPSSQIHKCLFMLLVLYIVISWFETEQFR